MGQMATTYTTIRVRTAPGTNASRIGERYGGLDGVAWRNSVDRCDSDGCGRVFLDCEDEETAEYVRQQLEDDDDVKSYSS
jgi:hypothetical protein